MHCNSSKLLFSHAVCAAIELYQIAVILIGKAVHVSLRIHSQIPREAVLLVLPFRSNRELSHIHNHLQLSAKRFVSGFLVLTR